jgi:hypothetical protein
MEDDRSISVMMMIIESIFLSIPFHCKTRRNGISSTFLSKESKRGRTLDGKTNESQRPALDLNSKREDISSKERNGRRRRKSESFRERKKYSSQDRTDKRSYKRVYVDGSTTPWMSKKDEEGLR